jgi:hypothetical protein
MTDSIGVAADAHAAAMFWSARRFSDRSRNQHDRRGGIVNRCAMLIGILLLGSVGPASAGPPNAPEVVYIDGLPCNRFCQFYMARFRAANDHAAQRREPASNHAVRDRAAVVAAARNEMSQAALQTPSAAAYAKRGDVADPRSDFGFSDGLRMDTFSDRVMAAAAVAEQLTMTTSAAAELKVMNADRADQAAIAPASSGGRADQAEARVALLIARTEIKSLAYLSRSTIAIDAERSSAAHSLRAAFTAEGAADLQVSASARRAIDRLIAGEVPGAVLALVSADAAKAFPDIAGFKIFRVPLPPRS